MQCTGSDVGVRRSHARLLDVATFSRSGRALWRQLDDRVIAVLRGSAGQDLLGAAAMIWIALDEPRTLDALAEQLAEFGVGREDLRLTLDELVRHGLVSTVCQSGTTTTLR